MPVLIGVKHSNRFGNVILDLLFASHENESIIVFWGNTDSDDAQLANSRYDTGIIHFINILLKSLIFRVSKGYV